VPDPTFYLFDGFNVLHAGSFSDPRELVDQLASFVAVKGARGVVVFDGGGEDRTHGPLEVRYAPHADAVLERLAAELRGTERVCLVSSDLAVRGTSGQEVTKVTSATFVRDLEPSSHQEEGPHRLAERLDRATRDRLERLRRNRSG
jgi:predicted RNA-binding protein with PIN domain